MKHYIDEDGEVIETYESELEGAVAGHIKHALQVRFVIGKAKEIA